MKRTFKCLLLAGLTSTTIATSALAQAPRVVIDEWGNGTFEPFPGGPTTPLVGVMAVEPMSGMLGLSYVLPFAAAPGDVQLIEPGQSAYSDVIRFAQGPQSRVWFFSDLPDPSELFPPPADVGLPPPSPLFTVTLTEIGPEGNNYAPWTPTPGSGAPGDIGPGVIVNYLFISDGVIPEPGSLTLAALGGGLLLALRLRRRASRG